MLKDVCVCVCVRVVFFFFFFLGEHVMLKGFPFHFRAYSFLFLNVFGHVQVWLEQNS